MATQNKDFWEKDNVIETQEVVKHMNGYELFMLEQVTKRYKNFGSIDKVKIFGCGTGREVLGVYNFFKPKNILASDISSNMIAKCKENLKTWQIDNLTDTVVINAKDFNISKNEFEVATLLNSMMTYVADRKDRLMIFENCYRLLKPNGVLVGTVHNQNGIFLKSTFFKIKKLFKFVLGDTVGNRYTGFKGFKVKGYYYDKKTLINDLEINGFFDIEVYSLEEYFAKYTKFTYDRKTGDNNLFFIASKPQS